MTDIPAPTHETPTPAPAPRKRRKWPWVLLSLFILLVLLLLLAPTIASTAPVRSIVVSKINNSLNGKLDVADWSIGWTSGVTLNGVKLDDANGRRIAEVSSIRLPISLIGAARGNYDLGDVVIDKPNLVNVEVYQNGTTNLDKLAKATTAAEKSHEPKAAGPSKIPDVKGKVSITDARGTISFPDSKRPPIFLDSSNITLEILGINEAIKNKIQLAYHVGNAPPGTINIEGSASAIKNNQVNVDQLKADQSIQLAGVDLSAFAPFVGNGMNLAGISKGTLKLTADTLKSASVNGALTVDNLAVSGAPLKGSDTYQSKVLSIPINISITPQGDTSLVKIEKLQVESDHVLVDVTGQAPQQAVINASQNKAPGATGGFAIAVSAKEGAVPALTESLRHTLGLQDAVKITAGKFATHVRLDLAPDKTTVKQDLDVQATGLDDKKQLTLEPIHLETAVTALPTGKSIPDLRDVALNLTSVFATIAGGGASLDALDIHGDFDLARLNAQLAQFVDLQGKSFSGNGKFQVTSKGDLTKLAGVSQVTANVTLNNIVAHGVAQQGDIAQPRAVVDAKATLARGQSDADPFIAGIPDVTVTFQSGDPQTPVIDLLITATKVSLTNLAVEKFEVQKLSVPNLATVQQQFGAFFPPDLRAASGSINATVTGSYQNNTLQFDQKAQLRAVTLQKLDANKQPHAVLENETEDIAAAGSLQQADPTTTTITLNTLSATSSNKLFTVTKSPSAPLVLTLRNGAVAGNGELAINSDLKRLLDALQSFSSSPAPAPNAPGQLTAGTFSANLKLAQSDKGGDIRLSGGIDNLSVTTAQAPIANEKIAINVAATTPPDFSSVAVSSAVVDSSFAKTTVSDALLQLSGGTFDMLQKAKVQVSVPDINKAMNVAQAFSPPAAAAAPDAGAAPTTQPLPPLQVSGGAVVELDLTRDKATQTTHVTIPSIAASKVSLVRGDRRFTFDKPINLKLVADLATENVTTTASTQPTQQIKQLDVKQLDGDLGGLATLAMPAPLSVTNLTAATPTANGKITVAGALEPLTRLLSVVQGAEPMPYRGDYAINQAVGTQNNQIHLTGDATINKLIVLQADNKTPAFSEDKLVVANDVIADTTAKSATINNVALNMTSSKAAGLAVKGKVSNWDTQRNLEGVAIDLSYDLAKIWQLAKPMLSPEMQKNYQDLVIAGSYQRTINVSGSFPANAQNDWHQSIKTLSADGAIAIQHLNTSGLDLADYELPFTLDHGVVTTLYKNKPKAERAPKPAKINNGAGDFGSMVVDLTTPAPMLSIGKNQQLLKDVALNPIFADKLGKFASVLFKNPQQATGLVNVTVVQCDHVPLGDLITQRNAGQAKVDVQVHDLHLDSPLIGAIAKAAQLGNQGITGEIRESNVVYAGDAGGITRSQINIFLTRKGVQIPLSFTGDLGLKNLDLHNAMVSIPSQLFGSDELTRIFPSGMKLPVTGTVDNWKLDTSNILKQNASGILGGLLNGNKKDNTGSNNATGGNKKDVGGIIGDILGGNQNQQQQQPEQPAPPPKKKKKQ